MQYAANGEQDEREEDDFLLVQLVQPFPRQRAENNRTNDEHSSDQADLLAASLQMLQNEGRKGHRQNIKGHINKKTADTNRYKIAAPQRSFLLCCLILHKSSIASFFMYYCV